MLVYVLELEGGKIYVGKTKNLEQRLVEHRNGGSSAWTRKHKFIRKLETFENSDGFDEGKVTLRYMAKLGIDNVRGGPYVQENLTDTTKREIMKCIRMATDLCVKCGSRSHYVSNCTRMHPPGRPTCEHCGSDTHFTEDCRELLE